MALVKLYANLRTITGMKELRIPGLSLREVLEKLAQDQPGLERLIFEGGRLRLRVIITANGQTLNPETSLDTPVSEMDQIAVFPPVAGG